jgi:hypothetical protein
VKLEQQSLVALHVREIPPTMVGIEMEDRRGGFGLVVHRREHRLAHGDLIDDLEDVRNALVVCNAAVVAQRQRTILRRRRETAPEAAVDVA